MFEINFFFWWWNHLFVKLPPTLVHEFPLFWVCVYTLIKPFGRVLASCTSRMGQSHAHQSERMPNQKFSWFKSKSRWSLLRESSMVNTKTSKFNSLSYTMYCIHLIFLSDVWSFSQYFCIGKTERNQNNTINTFKVIHWKAAAFGRGEEMFAMIWKKIFDYVWLNYNDMMIVKCF